MKSEKFWENLKIHAGGDDKQRIQFAPPNSSLFNESESLQMASARFGLNSSPADR